MAFKSYDKLKEILNITSHIHSNSAPKLDGKGFLKSLGMEVLAQEDGILNTNGKWTGDYDLRKLEYCSKVILTALYLALPSAVKKTITDIETYTLQSNGFRLKISASKYLRQAELLTQSKPDIETYTLQSNGFCLKISASKYLQQAELLTQSKRVTW